MKTITAPAALAEALSRLQRQGYQIDQLTDMLWQVLDPFTRISTIQPTGALIDLADRFTLLAADSERRRRCSSAPRSVKAALRLISVSLPVNSQP